jgi:hypothetical protein
LAASRCGGKLAAGFLLVIWGLALLVLLITPPLAWIFVVGFAVLMAGLAAAAVKSRRIALVSGLATTLVVLGFGGIWLSRYRELAALRDEFPAASISDRLAYETHGHNEARRDAPDSAGEAMGDNRQDPQPIAGELARLEQRLNTGHESDWRLSRRKYALARLSSMHEHMVSQFTIALGFGVSRMSPGIIDREHIEMPELPSLTVPERPEAPYGVESPELNVDAGQIVQAEIETLASPNRETLREFHEIGVADFSNPNGFGFVNSREKVFGFQPHGFRNQPKLPEAVNASSRWRIASLELVSLLKHEVPAAYQSKNLPRMDELTEAPTRPLDGFEANALGQLRSGEQIVVEEDADELRMVGSLRAAEKCTACHSVSRGDLLGAFTYRLRRDSPTRKRPAPAAKPVS